MLTDIIGIFPRAQWEAKYLTHMISHWYRDTPGKILFIFTEEKTKDDNFHSLADVLGVRGCIEDLHLWTFPCDYKAWVLSVAHVRQFST